MGYSDGGVSFYRHIHNTIVSFFCMLKKDKPWYAEGLRFQCSLCGNCCSGPDGEIPLQEQDSRRLAKYLGLSLRAFKVSYTIISESTNNRVLKMNPTPGDKEGLDCIFLDREQIPGKAVCKAHAAKPKQCQAWPFWPSSLESLESWKEASKHCPGIGQGDGMLTRKEIEKKRRLIKGPEKKFGPFERGWE